MAGQAITLDISGNATGEGTYLSELGNNGSLNVTHYNVSFHEVFDCPNIQLIGIEKKLNITR